MVDLLKTRKRLGRPTKVIGSEELQNTLLSEACLTRWAHHSIYKRCVKIKQLYNVDVPKETLRRFYKKNGLGYSPARAALYPHKKDLDVLEEERQAYAMKLSEFIVDEGVEVIYFDETSFHS